MKIANIDRESFHEWDLRNLLNYLKNFNEIFREDVTYDNIKSHKKQGFILSLRDTVLGKPQGIQLNPRY